MPVFTAGTTALRALGENPHRVSLSLTNTHATQTLYIMKGYRMPTTTDFDFLLGPGLNLTLNLRDDGIEVQKPFNVIASGSSSGMAIGEFIDPDLAVKIKREMGIQ